MSTHTKHKFLEAFQHVPIYGITSKKDAPHRTVYDIVRDMLESGIRVVQYREKETTGLERYKECLTLRKLTYDYGALLLIDDFVDLALAVKADGVHIGQDDLPPEQVRKLLGPKAIIGLSTHSIEQLERANALVDCIDYIGVGPVFTTKTKPNASAVGLEYVQYARQHSQLPFVAIGGIKTNTIQSVFDAGASIVCVVSELVSARSMENKIHELMESKHKLMEHTFYE